MKIQKIKVQGLEGRGQMLRFLEKEYNSELKFELRTTYSGQLYADYFLNGKLIAVFNHLRPQKSWYYYPGSICSTLIKK